MTPVKGPNNRPKGEGSIFQRHDHKTCPPIGEDKTRPEHDCKGRWAGSLPLKDDTTNKRRYIIVYARPRFKDGRLKTDKQIESELRKKLNLLKIAKANNGGDLPSGSMTLAQLLDQWMRVIAEKEHRPKTVANFESVIRLHIIPAIGKVKLADLTPAHVRRVTTAIEDKGVGVPTAVVAYRVLSLALEHAFREGAVTENVAKRVKRPSAPPAELAVLTPADGLKLLQTVSRDRLGSLRAANLLTGARQGELLGLELDRVTDSLELSWQLQRVIWHHGCGENKSGWPCGTVNGASCPDRHVKFPRNSEHRHLEGGFWLVRPKTKAGYRVVPLTEPLRTIIERRAEIAQTEPNPHGLLWTADPKKDKHGRIQPLDGSPIDASTDNQDWHEALVRAGLERELERDDGTKYIEKKIRLHDARHTGASLFLQARVPEKIIMELMGHNSFAVTRGYQHVSKDQRRDAMERMAAEVKFELEQ